jgi:endoglucanase
MGKERSLRAFLITVLSVQISLVSAALSVAPASAQTVAQLGPGINLGNVFDAPGGEGTWRPLPAQESEFDAFKAAGFRHVRVPVTWGNHMGSTPPYAIDPAFLNRITEVVNWGVSRGLIVVLNAHHEDWFKKDPNAQAARFDALWRQIAFAFRNVPNKKLVFEILNESDAQTITDAETDAMNARVLAIIRKTNPARTVLIAAVGDNAGRLRDNRMAVPRDTHLMCTFHSYDPWSFASGETKTWGTEADKKYLLTGEPNFEALEKWSQEHHCPLYLGEFGSSTKVNPASRVSWYGFIANQCVRRGISYAVWDDAGGDEIYDRKTGQWATGILPVLFPH